MDARKGGFRHIQGNSGIYRRTHPPIVKFLLQRPMVLLDKGRSPLI